jgi:hypothetical protein
MTAIKSAVILSPSSATIVREILEREQDRLNLECVATAGEIVGSRSDKFRAKRRSDLDAYTRRLVEVAAALAAFA